MRLDSMKFISILLIILMIVLAYDIVFGRNGYQDHQLALQKLEIAQKRNKILEQRNLQVQKNLEDLRHENLAIEDLARTELGFIYPNETFYRVVKTRN